MYQEINYQQQNKKYKFCFTFFYILYMAPVAKTFSLNGSKDHKLQQQQRDRPTFQDSPLQGCGPTITIRPLLFQQKEAVTGFTIKLVSRMHETPGPCLEQEKIDGGVVSNLCMTNHGTIQAFSQFRGSGSLALPGLLFLTGLS